MTYNRALVPEDLNPRLEAVRWKRSFTRAATARALGEIQKISSDEVLTNWPDDRAADMILKGAVSPTGRSDLPGLTGVAALLALAPRSAAAQLAEGATRIDIPRGVAQFTVPLATTFTNAAFVGEGQPIPLKQGAFVGMTVGPLHKLGMLAALSRELEEASGGIAEIVISKSLEVAVGKGLDAALFGTAAATADNPAGLLRSVTPVTPVAGGGTTAMLGDLRALLAAITAAGLDASAAVFVAAPAQALAIELTAGPHFAHRIIEANSLAAGTVLAIVSNALVIAGDGGVPVIDIAKGTALHFADPASAISTVGTPAAVSAPVMSTYQDDLVALRCISRITWTAAPGSVQVVNSTTW